MRRTITTFLLAAALSFTLAPSALASHAGHTYSYDEEITTATPGAFFVAPSHNYEISNVPKGTEITATLTWEDDSTTDMELDVLGPGSTCRIFPAVNVLCLTDAAGGNVAEMDCDGATEPAPPSGDQRQVTVVADRPGTWTITPKATQLLPGESVDYQLDFTLSEAHGDIEGPSSINYLHNEGHCFLLE